MAWLKKIVVRDFRNIQLAELKFSPNINCISGNNGEGKTNLMDAIWYLSMTKSAFSSSDRYNFRHGSNSFSLSGTYAMENGTDSRFSISVEDGGAKKLRRDDKPYAKVSDHIGVLPVVMVSPSDISLVSESGEERRRFTNAVLSQMEHAYLTDIQQYNRLLLQRNKILKSYRPDLSLLKVFDERMTEYADSVYRARKTFVERLCPMVGKYHALISGGREEVSVRYVSDLDKAPLGSLLAASVQKDMVLKYTTAGVQRDDLEFLLDGHPLRKCGSQGQQKSFLVALKFSQYELMKQDYGHAPMLLLDDVFDKLDYGRISNLLSMVAGSDFGQIFITDSNKVRLTGLVDGITLDRAYFDTREGTFTQLQ